MKKFFITSSIAFLANTSIVSAAGIVPQCEGVTCSICDLIKLAHNVIQYAIQLSFALAVGMVVLGGYYLITAGGSEEKVTQGRKIVWYAVVGLGIVLSGWVLINTMFQILIKSPSPRPWNDIPDDCGLPGVVNTMSAPPVVGASGALEPQGPSSDLMTNPNDEINQRFRAPGGGGSL
ncbi:MAG: pilin [bacterium]|nr:pilin [bacterium]